MSDLVLEVVGDPPDDREEHPFTIEQLAAESGLTVRNIRSHRARGLLPPPVVRERVGYYGAEHVDRLRLVRQLQDEGFNLAAIKRVVERAPEASGPILSALELVQQPFETEQAQVATREELRRRFRVDDPEPVLRKAVEAGVLVELDEDRFEVPAPSLLDVAEEIVGQGVPLHHALAVVAKVRESCRSVAREFIRLFVDDVIKPFEAEGLPADRWQEIAGAIERLRPMSAQVVLAVYQLTMTAEVERAAPREFERILKKAKL